MTLAASKQTGWRQLISRWTGPTGLAATVLFLVVAVLLEVLIIYSSMALGLQDTSPLVWNVASLTISISPLFHLLPLTVIIVLFASWIYLTRNVAYMPAKKPQPSRTMRPLQPPRRYERKRFKRLRRFINRLNKGIEETGQKIRERIARTRLAKYFEQHFAGQTVFKNAWIIVLSFAILALVISLIVYPSLLPDTMNWLFGGGNSLLAGFVTWTAGAATAIGQALSPIGWIGTSINGALASIAPGFRSGVIGFATPIVQPLTSLDLTGKYVLIQNVAAWASALVALYAGRPGHRRR